MNILTALPQYAIDSLSTGLSPVTVQSYVHSMRVFARYIGEETKLSEITARQIRDFNAHLRTDYRGPRMDNPDRLSSASLHRYFKSLRSFFRWAETYQGIPSPEVDVKSPRYTNKEIEPFTKLEVQTLLMVCEFTAPIKRAKDINSYQFKLPDPLRNRAMILTLLDTGIRPGELARLRVKNLKNNLSKIDVIPHIEGKTRARTLEIQSITRAAILSYHQSRGKLEENDFVIAQADGSALNTDAIGKVFRALGTRARIKNCNAYRLRHTFAIEYLRNGGDVFTLQYFMGHSNMTTTRRYLSFVDKDREHSHKLASPVNNWRL